MKKRTARAMAILASKMPTSYEWKKIGHYMTGEKILEVNNDREVESGKTYKVFHNELVKIDHYKRIKNAWEKGKERGVIEYLQWLASHNEKLAVSLKDMEDAPVIETFEPSFLTGLTGAFGIKDFFEWLVKFLSSWKKK